MHGQAFAIGAVVIDGHRKTHDEFTARCPIKGDVDSWVKDNVLPAIANMQQSHDSYIAMREAFWEWYLKARAASDYVLVNNGYPVEYRFLIDCQEADIDERYWQHPFPLIELTSMLVALNLANEKVKAELLAKAAKGQNFRTHNPLDDAKLSALIAFEALK